MTYPDCKFCKSNTLTLAFIANNIQNKYLLCTTCYKYFCIICYELLLKDKICINYCE